MLFLKKLLLYKLYLPFRLIGHLSLFSGNEGLFFFYLTLLCSGSFLWLSVSCQIFSFLPGSTFQAPCLVTYCSLGTNVEVSNCIIKAEADRVTAVHPKHLALHQYNLLRQHTFYLHN